MTFPRTLCAALSLVVPILAVGCGGARGRVYVRASAPPPVRVEVRAQPRAEVRTEPVVVQAVDYDGPDAVTVSVTPPAPLEEIAPEAPVAGYVWVGGYWQWNGTDYQWVQGHWEGAPQPDYVWVDSGWVEVNGSYRFVRGRWASRGQAPVVRYVHQRPQVIVRPGARYQSRPVTVQVRPAVAPRPVVRARPSGTVVVRRRR